MTSPDQEFQFNIEEGEERETELKSDYIDQIAQTVTWSTDWTIQTIHQQIERDVIELNPLFQRRDAWNIGKKSRFIESLFLGLPIPQVVLAEEKINGRFLVVDGKQRLTTIRQFLKNELKLEDITHPEILGKRFGDIEDTIPMLARKFENQSIRSVIIRNWTNENLLYTIFYRLNSGSLSLSPQELRAALKPGPLMSFLSDYAEASEAISRIFKNRQPDPRMKDVELLLRYLSFKNFAHNYRGSFKEFLDNTCDYYNKDWKLKKDELKDSLNMMEETVDICYTIFNENAFRRYSNNRYESRFSRAVFDIQTYYITPSITPNFYPTIEREFQFLCQENTDFLKAVTSNTNNMPNTIARFKLFGESLSEIIGKDLQIPLSNAII